MEKLVDTQTRVFSLLRTNVGHAQACSVKGIIALLCKFVRRIIFNLKNPSSPSIHIQILQTALHTFPLRISWESLITDQSIFSLVIIVLTLITISLGNIWILLRENLCWSPLGHKGLKHFEYSMKWMSVMGCNSRLCTTSQVTGAMTIQGLAVQ